jgi:hypothetical protein
VMSCWGRLPRGCWPWGRSLTPVEPDAAGCCHAGGLQHGGRGLPAARGAGQAAAPGGRHAGRRAPEPAALRRVPAVRGGGGVQAAGAGEPRGQGGGGARAGGPGARRRPGRFRGHHWWVGPRFTQRWHPVAPGALQPCTLLPPPPPPPPHPAAALLSAPCRRPGRPGPAGRRVACLHRRGAPHRAALQVGPRGGGGFGGAGAPAALPRGGQHARAGHRQRRGLRRAAGGGRAGRRAAAGAVPRERRAGRRHAGQPEPGRAAPRAGAQAGRPGADARRPDGAAR